MKQFPLTIGAAYVYCDLVEHVPVGDTKAPLLRIVNRMSDCGDENVHEGFNLQLYTPLQKRCFDTVEITFDDKHRVAYSVSVWKVVRCFGNSSSCL